MNQNQPTRTPPTEPAVELWGEYVVVEIDGKVRVLNEHGCLWSGKRDDLKRALPTVKRTHVCKWEAAMKPSEQIADKDAEIERLTAELAKRND